MALKEEIEEILNRRDAMVKLGDALDETQREIGDRLRQSTAIARLLEIADVQNAAILRLAEEIDRTRGTV
ncbi:MAG TPA: hypothetical protein VFJ64_12345 [Solirubrobacterales bacterium]|nr:hypothetical protein [Solirubrobacterales bacterium]